MNSLRILEPGKIGNMESKNRIFFPAMSSWLAGETGEVSDELLAHYERRAQGGAGLIVVETTMACTAIDPYRSIVRQLRADHDCYTIGLFKLAEAIHEAGAKAAIQLSPGGGSQSSAPWGLETQGIQKVEKVSSSSVARMGGPPPRTLTVDEIKKMVELFGLAVQRAKLAEFDALEIHAMGGYLIAQFLSPTLNKREDSYGGDLQGRMKFLLELIQVSQAIAGSGFPILVRYAVDEFLPSGRKVPESQEIAKMLVAAGVHCISVNSGMGESGEYITPPVYIPRGHNLALSKEIKEVVNVPVMVAGGLDEVDLAESALRDGSADFIGMARGLLADPDLPLKLENGEERAIRRCIRCNECRGLNKRPLRCTINPQAGRDNKYPQIGKSPEPKKVVVVGGGPAGLEAAYVSARRGNEVTLFEKNNHLGGQLLLAAIPPHKEEIKSIVNYYTYEFRKLPNLKIVITEATPEKIRSFQPDAVILATGSEPVIPPEIKLTNPKIVKKAFEVLTGASIGKKVIIVGGGMVGCETACFLAQQGKEVVILELLGNVGMDMEPLTLKCLLKEFQSLGLMFLVKTMVTEINDRGVIAIQDGQTKEFAGDAVVLAIGYRPVNGLEKALKGVGWKVMAVGNARGQGKIRNAVSEGFVAALSI